MQQQKDNMIKIIGSIILLASLLVPSSLAQNRASPLKVSGNNKLQYKNDTCGPLPALAQKVEVCAKPLTDILQGTLKKWPKTDNDIVDLCQDFDGSEKCIRDTSRRCATGLQKIVISTLANSVHRVRKRECNKSKYPSLLKTTKCVEANQNVPQLLIANATSRLSVIENQIINLDQKTNAICCMIGEIEAEMKRNLYPICPTEAQIMIKMYRSVLEDVTQLICRTPKCNDWTKGYKIPPIRASEFEGIIASLLRIVFSLSN